MIAELDFQCSRLEIVLCVVFLAVLSLLLQCLYLLHMAQVCLEAASAAAAAAAFSVVSMTALRTPRLVRIGTDFSGFDTALIALRRLPHIPLQLAFCSDSDQHCKKLLLNFHEPVKFYDDASSRKQQDELPVDVYIATPPCQPWSSQGKRKGLKDPRGQLLKVPLVYISRHRPRLCMVENVKGLCAKKNRGVLKGIKQTLQKLKYRVFMGVLNASDFQVPQNRQRLFIIAIRQDSYRRTFRWPKKKGKRSLSSVLDPPRLTDQPGRLPQKKRGRDLAKEAYKKVFSTGVDPRKTPVAIDVGCSKAFATYGVDISRTLCYGRAKTGGFWLSNKGRKMTTEEMMKVSGLNPDEELLGWEKFVSKASFQGMLGNCVPVPLVGSVLQNAMHAAGLISHTVEFPA